MSTPGLALFLAMGLGFVGVRAASVHGWGLESPDPKAISLREESVRGPNPSGRIRYFRNGGLHLGK